MFPILYC